MVLVLPLAVVSAADLDLRGGVGEREYRPSAVAELRPEYRLGMGQIDLDLRDVELPAGPHRGQRSRVGIGEARRARARRRVRRHRRADRRSARPTCPSASSDGPDIDIDESDGADAPRHAELLVNADIGVGHLQIDRATAGAGCA